MNRVLIVVSLALISFGANALRCGNTLPTVGDDIGTIRNECVIDHEYHVQNTNNDTTMLYIKEGNFMHVLVFTDGVLYTIDGGQM